MGFKRTNDGRVFFQGSDDDQNETSTSPQRRPLEEGTPKSAPSQLQILSLLKSLNERLKTTQAERNYMRRQLEAYREVIEALEDKSEKNEQSYAKLEKALLAAGGTDNATAASPSMQRTEALMKETLKEMAETRKLVLEIEDKAERAQRNTGALQKMQQDQAQKMARSTASYAQMLKRLQESEDKQDNIAAQLEDTIAQQAKISRKIDKVSEDRARFMRKIERIEETVIQTRDALNAKAMVLLTDQGAASAANLLEDEDQTLGEALLQQQAAEQVIDSAPMPPVTKAQKSRALHRNKYIQLAGISAVLGAAVFSGWLMGETNKTPRLIAPLDTPTTAPEPTALRAPAQNWTTQEDASAFAEQSQPPARTPSARQIESSKITAASDDIGTVNLQDEEAMLELLGSDPDAVATALNAIEPGTPNVEPLTQATQVSRLTPEITKTPAPATTRALQPEQAKPAFDPANYTPISRTADIQPDPALPDVIKQVEEQAFAGAPEAQHDLAAVYTAGHAGVQQDYNRAAYWFRKAADQGIANARYNLGVLHHQGLGTPPNMNEAIYWYDKAAALGHPEAQYNLGIAYIEGIGVTYSPTKAAENFENAANGGVMEAAYNLGLIYENGLMGQVEPDKALMWYKRAADTGSPEAKSALEQLAKALDIGLEDVNRLVETMQGSAPQSATSATKKQPVVTETPKVKEADESSSAPIQGPIKIQEDAAPQNLTASSASPETLANLEQEFAQITLAQVQEQLMRLGLYPGPADGISGPLTTDAIRSYQAQADLPVNGQASPDLLSHMLQAEPDVMDIGSRAE